MGDTALIHRPGPVVVIALAACAFMIGFSGDAVAHPFGPPPQAVVAGDGHEVTVQWSAEEDDALTLGISLDLLDPLQLDWTQDGPTVPGDADQALLPPSEPLEAYVLDNIRVWQDGVVCPGRVEPFDDFVTDGATTVHQCPEPIEAVDLEISMLHDIHEAYRTFAMSEGPAQPDQAVLTSSRPRLSWLFGVAAARAEQGSPWMLPIGGVALVLGGAAAFRRRQRRRTAGAATGDPADRPGRELTRSGSAAIMPLGLLAVADDLRFGWLEGEFVKLVDLEHVGVLLGVGALLIAFGIGAAHALAPGHGKALIGAYLVGSRGRARDAVALGSIVAVMHCFSVLVFGGVLFTTVSLRADVGRLMPWMSVAAGVLVVAVGAGLVIRQFRMRVARRVALVHHGGASRDHDHGHGHDHPHHHSHQLPEGVRPLSRRGIIALGVSGGLLPSPSAFLVLTTAILMDRAFFGLMLVATFSLGLAATLTVFGLAAVRGRTFIERRAQTMPRLSRLTAVLPLVTSVAVLLGGFWITATALMRL